jgi:hypothetical protein
MEAVVPSLDGVVIQKIIVRRVVKKNMAAAGATQTSPCHKTLDVGSTAMVLLARVVVMATVAPSMV